MTRDEAREKFASSGLKYQDLSRQKLQRLRNMINMEMIKSGLFNGKYRARQRPIFCPGDPFFAGIECRSYYFERREAVSFNRDGFIGFAGWSDEKNVQPILSGFSSWVDELTKP